MFPTSLLSLLLILLPLCLAGSASDPLPPTINPNPSPEHHPRTRRAPLDATTATRVAALSAYKQLLTLQDDIWADHEEINRLAKELEGAKGEGRSEAEMGLMGLEIHAALYNLTRTVEASGSSASRTKVAVAMPSASALAPLRIRGAVRSRVGTTVAEVATAFSHTVATVHSSLRHIRAVESLLQDRQSVLATADELDRELKLMLEGLERRLEGVTSLVAEDLTELRTRYPGHQTQPLSLHRLFHSLAEAKASAPYAE